VRRYDPGRKKIAVVARAHYLVRVMYALLKQGTFWREATMTAWRCRDSLTLRQFLVYPLNEATPIIHP